LGKALITVLALAAMLAVGPGCGPSRPASPPVEPTLTVAQKIEISRDAWPQIERRYGPLLEDLAVQAYVRTVGERLSRHTPLHDLPYRFAVLATENPVMQTMPGGDVFISRGLLAKLETEAELAALLAHAAAHINAGHAERQTPPALLAEAVRLMAQTEAATAPPPAAKTFDNLVAQWIDVRFTPAMETEADRLAVDYVAAAGYNPDSVIRVAGVLATVDGPGAKVFLAMHPSPEGRLEELRGVVLRKYPDYGGREARGEYQREVVDRLKQ
jgi:predicted Zn-dependent protease